MPFFLRIISVIGPTLSDIDLTDLNLNNKNNCVEKSQNK